MRHQLAHGLFCKQIGVVFNYTRQFGGHFRYRERQIELGRAHLHAAGSGTRSFAALSPGRVLEHEHHLK